jgi:hypothetical protein
MAGAIAHCHHRDMTNQAVTETLKRPLRKACRLIKSLKITRKIIMDRLGQEYVIAQPGQRVETTVSESFPRTFSCPLEFKLYDLQVKGTSMKAACPANSPFIVAGDEAVEFSVNVEFTPSPLAKLLMCLGTPITIVYSLEGYGRRAAELDLEKTIITEPGKYAYKVSLKAIPNNTAPAMTPGLYQIAAVARIGGTIGKCPSGIWGHGYVDQALLEVYAAGEES